jgi:hypothetical protein
VLTVDLLVWHSQTTPLAALPVEQGEITRKSRTGVSAGNRRFCEQPRSFNCRQTAAVERLSRQAMRECAGKRLLAAAAVVAAQEEAGIAGAGTATRPRRSPRRRSCDAMMCPRVLRPWRDLRELR